MKIEEPGWIPIKFIELCRTILSDSVRPSSFASQAITHHAAPVKGAMAQKKSTDRASRAGSRGGGSRPCVPFAASASEGFTHLSVSP